jgi:hypothetical protein
MIRISLVVQMPDARYVGRVLLALCPDDRQCLRFAYLEYAIPLPLDDKVLDGAPLRATFGAGLNVDFGHDLLSPGKLLLTGRELHNAKGSNTRKSVEGRRSGEYQFREIRVGEETSCYQNDL